MLTMQFYYYRYKYLKKTDYYVKLEGNIYRIGVSSVVVELCSTGLKEEDLTPISTLTFVKLLTLTDKKRLDKIRKLWHTTITQKTKE